VPGLCRLISTCTQYDHDLVTVINLFVLQNRSQTCIFAVIMLWTVVFLLSYDSGSEKLFREHFFSVHTFKCKRVVIYIRLVSYLKTVNANIIGENDYSVP